MHERPSGRRPDDLRPVRMTRHYTPPRGRVGPGRVRRNPGHLHRERREAGAPIPPRVRLRMGHRRVRNASPLDERAYGPRGRSRAPGRPDVGNSAAHRPEPPGGHRSRSPRRTYHPHRLRRHPGGRRNPHRGDLRRLRRARRRGCDPARSPRARAASRAGRGGLGRDLEGPADPRPRLRRGPGGRDGHERRHERERRVRGDPGHGRGACVPRPGAGRDAVARPAPESIEYSRCSGRSSGSEPGPRRGDRQSRQARGDRAPARRLRVGRSWRSPRSESSRPRKTGSPSSRTRSSRRVTRRGAPGALPWPTIPGSSSMRLGGAPGVHSARYAGPGGGDAANNEKLLRALAEVPEGERSARFECAVVWMQDPHDPAPFIARGTWTGRVLEAPRGANGFGYDPLFLDPATGRTAAELAPERKDALSHRGRALRALRAMLAP